MGKPNDRRKFSGSWALAGLIFLVAGAAWAGGVVYVGHGDQADDAFLGVTLTEETDHPEGGAKVVSVIDDSPADLAGMQDGDIIQGLAGEVVRGPGALSKRLDEHDSGDQVSIRLIRDGREMTLEVELGEHEDSARLHVQKYFAPGDMERLESWSEDFSENWSDWADEMDDSIRVLPHFGRGSNFHVLRSGGRPKLGVQLSETTPELREHFGADAGAGVLISMILPDTPAADAGLRVGDLIVAIDGESVSSASEIVEELGDKEGETFPIDVIRDGRSVSIDVDIPEREEQERHSGPRAYYFRQPPAPPVAPSALVPPRRLSLPELPALPALPELPAPPASSGARGLRVV